MQDAPDPSRIVVDCIENVPLDSASHFNELRTIRMLSVGVLRIAGSIKAREEEWARRNGGRLAAFSIYGLDIDGNKDNLDFLACMFHWFGTSVCNLARLVGFLHALELGHFSRQDLSVPAKHETVRKAVKEYLNSVSELRDVLLWRNKVAAHFAITDPRATDNKATLDASVMFPLAFTNGRYRVSDLTLTYSRGDGTSESSSIPSWSVTEVFEALSSRYWPNISVAGEGQPPG